MADFLELVSSADPAMAVVTTGADGVAAGCLVGFHGQSGVAPQHYAVWLSKANHTYRTALEADHLAVHLLATADHELAEHFGTQTGEEVDKFAGHQVEDGPGGVPLLRALTHRLVGRRLAVLDVGGDHACFALEVVQADSEGAFEPLRNSAVEHLRPGHETQERSVTPQG